MSLPKVKLVNRVRRRSAVVGPRAVVVRYPAFVVRRVVVADNKIESKLNLKRKLSSDDDDDDEADCNSTRVKAFKPTVDNNTDIVVNKDSGSEELNESDLWTIANSSAESLLEWKEIGSRLELTQLDLKLLEHRYGSDLRECFYQMLLLWRQRCPENCQMSYLKSRLSTHSSSSSLSSTTHLPTDLLISRLKTYHTQLEQKYKLKSDHQQRLDNHHEIRLEEKWLWQCSEWICGEWKPVGRTLGLAESTLIQIESKHGREGCRECSYQMLLHWMEQFYSSANLNTICSSLVRLGLNWSARQLLHLVLFE